MVYGFGGYQGYQEVPLILWYEVPLPKP
jgi:hypothetical protein